MKQHLLRVAVATATCSVLSVTPGAHAAPSGSTLGFFHTEIGWQPATPDTSEKACTPKLHADTSRPEFYHLVIGATTLSLTERSTPHAYVAKHDCGSQAVIGAFRMTDEALYSIERPADTGWYYLHSEDLTRATLEMLVTRNFVRDEPTFTGTVLIEAGAWWGRPDAAGTMVYYPAGCVQQSWLYTVIAWSNTVEAQQTGPETPCAQPPLPGTPELL